jgi:ribonucleotide monophosphatase NagD (HAD superfamily)
VVVGHDLKYTYAKLCIASMYIHSGGAKFIACNDDAYDMIKDRRVPGAGAMVAGIKYSLGQLERDQSSTRHDSD